MLTSFYIPIKFCPLLNSSAIGFFHSNSYMQITNKTKINYEIPTNMYTHY
jgi:hypothetical protein